MAIDPMAAGRDRWEKRYGTETATAMEAVSSVVRVREILVSFMDRYLTDAGMTFFEYDVLNVIADFGGGSLPLGKIAPLARRFFNHQTSMTNVISRLADRGIVSTRQDPGDKRVTLVELTPAGRRRLKKAHETLAKVGFGLGALSPDDQKMLIELLYRVRVDHNDIRP